MISAGTTLYELEAGGLTVVPCSRGRELLGCALRHGLDDQPLLFDQLEDLRQHIEVCHHNPVARDDESSEAAVRRFLRQHPEAVDCEQCRAAGMPWARGLIEHSA